MAPRNKPPAYNGQEDRRSARIIGGVVESMRRQEERQARAMEQMESFFAEGAPAELRRGAESAAAKAGSFINDMTGTDLTGFAGSLVGGFTSFGQGITKSFTNISNGIGNFLFKDPKEKKTMFEQADDIANLTGHALKRGSIYTHDIHTEEIFFRLEPLIESMAEDLKIVQRNSTAERLANKSNQMDIDLFRKWQRRIAIVRGFFQGQELGVQETSAKRLREIKTILANKFGDVKVSGWREDDDKNSSGLSNLLGFFKRSEESNSKTMNFVAWLGGPINSLAKKTDTYIKEQEKNGDNVNRILDLVGIAAPVLEGMFNELHELAKHALQAGSIYTHDIHTEGLMEDMLEIEKDREAREKRERRDKTISQLKGGAVGAGFLGGAGMFMSALIGPAMGAFLTLGPILLGIASLGLAAGAMTGAIDIDEIVSMGLELMDFVMEIGQEVLPVLVSAFASFAGPMMELVKAALPTVKDLILTVANILKDTVIPGFQKVTQTVIPIFKKLIPVIGQVLGKIFKVVGVLLDAVIPIVDGLMMIAGTVIDAMLPVVTIFTDLAVSILPEFISVIKSLGEIVMSIAKVIFPALMPVLKLLAFAVFKPMAIFLKYFVLGVAWPLRLSLKLIAEVVKSFAEFPAFWMSFLWITNKIGVLFPTLNSIRKGFGLFSDGIIALGNFIRTAGVKVKLLGRAIKQGTTNPIIKFFGSIVKIFGSFTKIGSWIVSVGGWVGKGISMLSKFFGAFKWILGKLALPLTIVFAVLDFIKGFNEEEGGFLKKLGAGLFAIVEGILGLPLRLLTNMYSWLLDKMGLSFVSNWIREVLVDSIGDTWLGKKFLNMLGISSEKPAKIHGTKKAPSVSEIDAINEDAINKAKKAEEKRLAQEAARKYAEEKRLADEKRFRQLEAAKMEQLANANAQTLSAIANVSGNNVGPQAIPVDSESLATHAYTASAM